MKSPTRRLLLVAAAALCTLAFDGPFSQTRPAAAQGFGRGREGGGGGGGEDRRESFRRRFGGGEGGERGGGFGNGGSGRDGRNRGGERGGGDGERRGDSRSNGSGSSGGGGGSSSPSSGSSDSKSSTSSSSSMSNEKYAKDIVEKYDKNGDKMLQKDEQADLNSTNRAADLDKDGVITIDELVAHHSAPASTTPPATTSSSSGEGSSGSTDSGRHKGESEGAKRVYTGSAGGPASNSKEGDKRRTYRFSTSADRLPKSLPSYFSRDTNGDGQVSMSEYSRTWSKSTVDEFRKYDLNDDGMITAKEATHSSGSGG